MAKEQHSADTPRKEWKTEEKYPPLSWQVQTGTIKWPSTQTSYTQPPVSSGITNMVAETREEEEERRRNLPAFQVWLVLSVGVR